MEHILACPKCGGANRSGQLVCRFCGQSLAHKCTRCQIDIDPGTKNCPYCGEILPAWSIEQAPASEDTSDNLGSVLV
jgi:RNA polymerase subunit RPABC4/transcription elongation factor Spt4